MRKKQDKKHIYETTVTVPEMWTEAVRDVLFEVGASVVEERTPGRGLITLICHYPAAGINSKIATIGSFLAEVARRMEFKGELPKVEIKKIENRAWAKEARESFKPVKIAGGFIATPTWIKKSDLPDGKVLRIDPGEAFGTGMHASTKLAARLLLDEMKKCRAPSVLDVGTGTGILAMIAAKSGASRVAANDNDPAAVETARENVKRNRCVVELTAKPVEKIRSSFDIVVANILLETLELLAPDLVRLTKPGGAIVMSGLLVEQETDITKRMAKLGIAGPEKRLALKEWLALRFRC